MTGWWTHILAYTQLQQKNVEMAPTWLNSNFFRLKKSFDNVDSMCEWSQTPSNIVWMDSKLAFWGQFKQFKHFCLIIVGQMLNLN